MQEPAQLHECLYRYEYHYYYTEGDPTPVVKVNCHQYKVNHLTKRGAQIRMGWDYSEKKWNLKFVNLEARKQWASTTKQRALEAFLRRKQIQRSHLSGLLQIVEIAEELAQDMLAGGKYVDHRTFKQTTSFL